jgi:hypothetical protein
MTSEVASIRSGSCSAGASEPVKKSTSAVLVASAFRRKFSAGGAFRLEPEATQSTYSQAVQLPRRTARGKQTGSALLIVLILTFFFSALAVGTTTVVGVETTVAGRFRDGVEALYVADAGLSVVVAELRELADWSPVLQGAVRSPASRGPFLGSVAIAGGTVLLCCGGRSVAGRLARESAADLVPARRGLVWQPYLWSAWDALVPQPGPGQVFVAVVIQDDEEDGDGQPATDLNGVVTVRSEALRSDGLRRVVEALVAREPAGVRILRWREVR